jgi:sugar phosphate permease
MTAPPLEDLSRLGMAASPLFRRRSSLLLLVLISSCLSSDESRVLSLPLSAAVRSRTFRSTRQLEGVTGAADGTTGRRLIWRPSRRKEDGAAETRAEATSAANKEGIIRSSEAHDGSNLAMSATLAAVYFSVMGAKCALPAALALLLSPTTGLSFEGANAAISPQQAFSKLFFRSTLAVACGKLLLGPVIDRVGGIRSLQVALLTLAANLLVISSCQSYQVFATCWIMVDFVFSCCWAGCIHAIHQTFPPHKWARQISNVAAASRLGNAVAFLSFASLLQTCVRRGVQQPWRPVFAVSGLLQLVPVSMLTVFGNQAVRRRSGVADAGPTTDGAAKERARKRRPLQVLKSEIRRVDFWLHLTSRSVLMVFASFLLFVPTLMNQVYHATPAVASRVGSLYAIGCLLAVTLGSDRYGRLKSPTAKAGALAALLGSATVASGLQLGHVAQWWTMGVTASALSMLLWGVAFAIPFYIPPSLYALERGGVESSATIADVFDVAGFGFLAVFNGYVAGIQHSVRAAWVPTFALTTACAVVSLLSLSAAALRESPKEE